MQGENKPESAFYRNQCECWWDRVMNWLGRLRTPNERQQRVHQRMMARDLRRLQRTWSRGEECKRRTGMLERDYRQMRAVYPKHFRREDWAYEREAVE